MVFRQPIEVRPQLASGSPGCAPGRAHLGPEVEEVAPALMEPGRADERPADHLHSARARASMATSLIVVIESTSTSASAATERLHSAAARQS